MLRRLFGQERISQAEAIRPRTARRIDRPALDRGSGLIAHVPELGFIGRQAVSPNGRYVLLWRDGDDSGGRGGARDAGPGRYVLIDDDRVVAEGRAARPNDGLVADTGVFVLNDWRFGAALAGTFLAFAPDGRQILARPFAANLFNNGLSADGRRAVCQTCNAPGSPDSSRLTFFDLGRGVETGSCVPDSGWASSYEFPERGDVVRLRYLGGRVYDYAVDGRFIGRDAWAAAAVAEGDLPVMRRLLDETGDATPQTLEAMRDSLTATLANMSGVDPSHRALALRLKGQCCERLGDVEAALRAYDAALANDPKIGVKRQADRLRKRLSQAG